MRKLDRSVYTIIFIAWVLAMVVVIKPAKIIHSVGRMVTTEVITHEGVVSLYEIDWRGNRKFVRNISAGESTSQSSWKWFRPVNSQIFQDGDDGATSSKTKTKAVGPFKILRAILPREATHYNNLIRQWARTEPDGVYTKLFDERKLQHFIATKIEKANVIRSVSASIHSEGVDVSARAKLSFLNFLISGGGYVQVGENSGELYLSLEYVKIGAFRLPDKLLRILEEDFDEWTRKTDMAVKISKMRYMQGAIDITYENRNTYDTNVNQ